MAKKKIEFYSQCKFQRIDTDADVTTVANIDAKHAKVGRRMTFKGMEGIWQVKMASEPRERPNFGWGQMD
jgi:hypothetical protein